MMEKSGRAEKLAEILVGIPAEQQILFFAPPGEIHGASTPNNAALTEADRKQSPPRYSSSTKKPE